MSNTLEKEREKTLIEYIRNYEQKKHKKAIRTLSTSQTIIFLG